MTKFSNPKTFFLAIISCGFFGLAQNSLAAQEVANFSPGGGADQNFTVPAGVSAVNIEMRGGYGGDSTDCRHFGGRGAKVNSTLVVTPGETLSVEVGEDGGSTNVQDILAGIGGWPNGTDGEVGSDCSGAGGAGASLILRDMTVLAQAGGGGGAAATSDCHAGNIFPSGAGGGAGGDGFDISGFSGYSFGDTVEQGGGATWGSPDIYGQYARAGQGGYVTISWTVSGDTTPPAAPSGLSVS